MSSFLDKFQWLVTLVVLYLFASGRGAHGVFIAIYLVVPFLRMLFSKGFRTGIFGTARIHLHELKTAPQVSRKALFWWVAFPSLFLTLLNGVGISSNDNYPTVMTAASILTEGNLELSEYTPAPRSEGRDYCKEGFQNPYYLWCVRDGVRSAYPLGMVLPMLPVMGVAKILGRDLYNADNQWRLSKWTASLISALSLCLFFVIARSFVSGTSALWTTYFLMVGSTFTSIISQGIWSHDAVVLGVLLILYLETVKPNISLVLQSVFYGLLYAWMLSSRLNAVTVLLPLGLLLLYRRGMIFAIVLSLTALLLYTPLGLYYQSYYGSFLGPQYIMQASTQIPIHTGWALLGIFFSPAHGLLTYQPWLLLLGLYFIPSVRTSSQKLKMPFLLFLLSSVIFQVGLVSQWWCWWGGPWGSRLMSEIIPLLALLVLFPVEFLVNTHKRGLLLAFTLFSFFFQGPHLFLAAAFWNGMPLEGDKEGESRLWDWKSPPFLYPVLKHFRPLKHQ